MKQFLNFLVLSIFLLSGCAGVKLYHDEAFTKRTGLKFYYPKPLKWRKCLASSLGYKKSNSGASLVAYLSVLAILVLYSKEICIFNFTSGILLLL